MAKIKEKMLKAAKEKTNYITGNPHKTIVLPFKEELQVRKEWHYILKVMKGKVCSYEIYQKG